MRARAFFAWLGAAVLLQTALAAGFALWADPYRMYGTGFTSLKPHIYRAAALAKTYALERVRPAALLLGNSRVQIGFDPESKVWPDELAPVFNAGRSGQTLFPAIGMLRDALALGRLRFVLVALDFQDFIAEPETAQWLPPRPGAGERRLLVDRNGNPNPARPVQLWRDRLTTTLTLDAIADSFRTAIDQRPGHGVTMAPLGFDPHDEFRDVLANLGYHAQFAADMTATLRTYRRYAKRDFSDLDLSPSAHYVQAIMALAVAHDVRLVFVIPPYHAQYLEMLHRAGLWRSFEDWKRALVRLGAGDRARLIDFSGYDAYTAEPVPEAGNRISRMRWYWDSGHFTPALGDVMLREILTGGTGFGRPLDAASAERVIGEIRDSRGRYEAP